MEDNYILYNSIMKIILSFQSNSNVAPKISTYQVKMKPQKLFLFFFFFLILTVRQFDTQMGWTLKIYPHLAARNKERKKEKQAACFSLSYYKGREVRVTLKPLCNHYPYQETKIQSFSHSFTLKDPQSFKKGGLCALEFVQLCSEWLADLLTLCSSSWYLSLIYFSDTLLVFVFWVFILSGFGIQGPHQKLSGSQKNLAHCSPGM